MQLQTASYKHTYIMAEEVDSAFQLALIKCWRYSRYAQLNLRWDTWSKCIPHVWRYDDSRDSSVMFHKLKWCAMCNMRGVDAAPSSTKSTRFKHMTHTRWSTGSKHLLISRRRHLYQSLMIKISQKQCNAKNGDKQMEEVNPALKPMVDCVRGHPAVGSCNK